MATRAAVINPTGPTGMNARLTRMAMRNDPGVLQANELYAVAEFEPARAAHQAMPPAPQSVWHDPERLCATHFSLLQRRRSDT
jgi:hypothetical protein